MPSDKVTEGYSKTITRKRIEDFLLEEDWVAREQLKRKPLSLSQDCAAQGRKGSKW